MYHLAYFSSASRLFSPEELHQLLEQSRVKNASSGITGILLYKGGNFVQILEGEEQAVRDLFKIITADPRHKGVLTVISEPMSEREFADWSMAFRDLNLEKESDIQGYSNFMNGDSWETDEKEELSSKCRRLLSIFRRNMR